MASAIAIALAAIFSYWIYTNAAGFLKNLAAAKRSGLPYTITPWNIFNTLWLATHRIWRPLLEKLPASWVESWLPLVNPDWTWHLRFEPFSKKGDIFLTVAPGALHIWVANADAVRQITSRRDAFPKPLESYKILDIFGRNVITTEGAAWRQHRKITAPGFNEKNNALVFAEACSQAQGMLGKWTETSQGPTIDDVPMDVYRLALHIISRVGFGVRLLWPGEKTDGKESAQDAVFSGGKLPNGHSMSYETSLETLVKGLIWVILTPKWLMKRLPLSGAQNAYESYVNWGQYMHELFEERVKEARQGARVDEQNMDIMGSLVRSSYGQSSGTKSSPGQAEKGQADQPRLVDSEIMGNAFIMILAGHETTATTIHFALMELATNPRSQRSLQKEIDTIFGSERPESWEYDSNINTLLGGIPGAVLNEQLRIMPPVVVIPKSVSKHGDQVITIDKKEFILPAGAYLNLCAVGSHRNPKYWPTQPSKVTDGANDLDDFRPERWLAKTASNGTQQVDSQLESEDDEDFGGFTGQDTSAQLFRPARGAYIPFSDGPRSCLGRRLAQVKVVAVLAVIFQKYSIELAVDEWATDDEVARMTNEQRRVLYQKAQDKARKTIRGATTQITLGLHDGSCIPVRLVRKGEERFIHVVD